MPDDAGARPMVGKIKSEQDHADLLTYHMAVIRAAEAAVETAKGPVTEAKAELSDKQETLTKAFNAAKADLGRGYSREYLGGLAKDGRQKITALVDFEKQRARDKLSLNQPVFGQQPELFPGAETPAEAKDEMAYEAEGYLRGLRGAIDEIQDGDPPRFHQALMRGFDAGQKEAQARYLRAQELKAAAETPNAAEAPKDLNTPEPGTVDDEVNIEASVDRAKESLAAMSGAGETGDAFETPAAELAAQRPRRAIKDAKAGATSGAAAPAGVH
jgi:hypothetical protein